MPDDDLYRKVIEIAQEQAQAQTAMTELHRQNVSKLDTMANLLSAQTTSLIGISTALNQMNDAQRRAEESAKMGREDAVEEVKAHITQEFGNRFASLEFWRKPAFWLAIALLTLSNAVDALPKFIGLFK